MDPSTVTTSTFHTIALGCLFLAAPVGLLVHTFFSYLKDRRARASGLYTLPEALGLHSGDAELIGAQLLEEARKDPRFAQMLLYGLRRDLNEGYDQERLQPLLTELEAIRAAAHPSRIDSTELAS